MIVFIIVNSHCLYDTMNILMLVQYYNGKMQCITQAAHVIMGNENVWFHGQQLWLCTNKAS